MKSPFLVVQDFLSPAVCEVIVKELHIDVADKEKDKPLMMERQHPIIASEIAMTFQNHVSELENHYGVLYKGLEVPVFQFFPENPSAPAQAAGCENSQFVKRKWVMTKDIDLVAYVWLKDYNETAPFDPDFEVYGGKMEFPVYDFSLVPQRGTMVIFPAGPHFIKLISPIMYGDLYQIKLNIKVSMPDGTRWLYQPNQFSGTYKDWFNDLM